MDLSDKRHSALYAAISEPVMSSRIAIRHSENVLGQKNVGDIDDLLYHLQLEIWREVRKVLNISDS